MHELPKFVATFGKAVHLIWVVRNLPSRCYTSNHWRDHMRIARGVLGVLLVLIGAVCFLQGINVWQSFS